MLQDILRPITINRMEVKNRIARASHGTHFGHGKITEELIAYHEMRAKSGVGLNILEATVVHPSTSCPTVNAFDDSVIPGFSALAKACAPHGMRNFVQLWHGGHRWAPANGTAPWSASNVPCPLGSVNVPFAMTQNQIDDIVDAFAAAAMRVKLGGLDGIELHFGHGYLVHQFLCGLTNKREDSYGGSLDNRMRFGREILLAVRERVGRAYPVGIRLSDYNTPGGLTPEEAGEVVRRLCADGLLDYVSASMGSPFSISSMLGAMDMPTGYMLSSALPIARQANVPTMIAGRYRTLAEGNQAIRGGEADIVSFVRAMIADGDLVAKTLAGQEHRVRPCIGCNQGCVAGIRTPLQRMLCTVNPAVGMEGTMAEDLIIPAEKKMKIVVVGGGPAGMEAARLAALSGHHIVLFEAQPRLGGTINIARRAPKLAAIGDITQWLEQELAILGVDVRLSCYMEAEDALAERPNAVIIATGSLPRMDGLQVSRPERAVPGFDQAHVVSSHDLLFMPRERLGSAALVFDDVGHYEAIACAEYLIEQGVKVTFVTRHSSFAPHIEAMVRTGPALRRLRKGDFTLVTGGRLASIGPDSSEIGYLDGEQTWHVRAETVVLVTYNHAQNGLYRDLGGGGTRPGFALHLVGDANAPRDLLMAMREGHLAGREAVLF